MSPDPQPNNQSRLSQLEESLGFIEVDSTRTREQIEELSKAVHELSIRMQRLETRLIDLNDRIETQDPGVVPPPHSAGPDVPRDPL